MPLVTCPDCGKAISDAAPLCIGCGRPMSAAARAQAASVATPAPLEIPASVPRSAYACPKCGGELVAFRALHESAGSDAPGWAVPPDRNSMAPLSPAGCGFALTGALITAGLVWFYFGFIWAVLAFFVVLKVFGRVARMRERPLVDARFAEAQARWERRHVCARCGAHVMRNDDGSFDVEDADAEIDALLRTGQKIQAIKLVRERTGLGLKEAKDAVEDREKQM